MVAPTLSHYVCRRRRGTCRAASVAVAQEEIKTALNGPVGLQMWSLREYLPKDLAGALAKVRAMGFREVEGRRTVEAHRRGASLGARFRRTPMPVGPHAIRTAARRCAGSVRRSEGAGRDLGGVPVDSARQGVHARRCP